MHASVRLGVYTDVRLCGPTFPDQWVTGVFIIMTIISKINENCDKKKEAQDDASTAEQKAAAMPLLAAARAAAETALPDVLWGSRSLLTLS